MLRLALFYSLGLLVLLVLAQFMPLSEAEDWTARDSELLLWSLNLSLVVAAWFAPAYEASWVVWSKARRRFFYGANMGLSLLALVLAGLYYGLGPATWALGEGWAWAFWLNNLVFQLWNFQEAQPAYKAKSRRYWPWFWAFALPLGLMGLIIFLWGRYEALILRLALTSLFALPACSWAGILLPRDADWRQALFALVFTCFGLSVYLSGILWQIFNLGFIFAGLWALGAWIGAKTSA